MRAFLARHDLVAELIFAIASFGVGLLIIQLFPDLGLGWIGVLSIAVCLGVVWALFRRRSS